MAYVSLYILFSGCQAYYKKKVKDLWYINKKIKNSLNKARLGGKYGANQRIFSMEISNHGVPGKPSRNSWDRPSSSEVWPQHTLSDLTKRQGHPSLTTRSQSASRSCTVSPGSQTAPILHGGRFSWSGIKRGQLQTDWPKDGL